MNIDNLNEQEAYELKLMLEQKLINKKFEMDDDLNDF